MAAENSDAMTLEQFKVYSGKNAGGGGLELLWSGSSSSNVSLSSYDNSGEALLVYFRGLDYTRTFAIVSVDGIGCSSYVRASSSGNTGSNVTFQYNPDSKTLLNSNKVLVYSVYKYAFEYFDIGKSCALAYILFIIIFILALLQRKLSK